MRYVAAAQLYWPIWLGFSAIGHTWIGMLVGSLIVIALWKLLWVFEFGNPNSIKE